MAKREDFRDLGLSYNQALHGMQTGVAIEQKGLNPDASGPTSPKHLRVGVNSAMVETAALALLLMEKGVFTEEEYSEALRLLMNNELALYEARAPKNVKLR